MNENPSTHRTIVAGCCLLIGNVLITIPAVFVGLGLMPWFLAAPLILVTLILAGICLSKEEIGIGATLFLAALIITPINGYISMGIANERLKDSPAIRQALGRGYAEELTRLVAHIKTAGGSIGPGPNYDVNTSTSATAIMSCQLGYTPSSTFLTLKFDPKTVLNPDDYEVTPDGVFRYIE